MPIHYKEHHLFQSGGRFYAVPHFLDPVEIQWCGRLSDHPAILSAATEGQVKVLIDELDGSLDRPEGAGTYEGYNLVRYRGRYHGISGPTPWVDLDVVEDCRRAGVISADSREQLQQRILDVKETVPVEFGGWLPVYEVSGDCGRHPQFSQSDRPPVGYRFTCSSALPRRTPSRWVVVMGLIQDKVNRAINLIWSLLRPACTFFFIAIWVSPRASLKVTTALCRLFWKLLRSGAGLFPIILFLKSRHFRSQLELAKTDSLVFLTSIPYTVGQNPWVVEIEDPTTLFYPLIHNGQTRFINLTDSPYYPIVKTLLEADHCKGIITHMRSTARMLVKLFRSHTINAKIHYTPLGVKLPDRWQRHDETEPEEINLLFTNSWCQYPGNFLVRGGLDILEAFAVLRARYPNLRLTLRTQLPPLDPHYQRILESGGIRVMSRFLPSQEMEALLAESHIFLLPAARVHIVSLLQAMSHGLGIVTSDGWGIEEYIAHEVNGLIVKGRYGKTSWEDMNIGMLRENYEPMHLSDPDIVDGIVESVSRLVEDRDLRRRLGRAARKDVETRFTLEGWNASLKKIFDSAMSNAMTPNRTNKSTKAHFADQLDPEYAESSRSTVSA